MNIDHSLRLLLLATLAAYLGWFLLPLVDSLWLSEEELSILQYATFGSDFSGLELFSWLLAGLTISCLIASMIYTNAAPYVLFGLVIVSWSFYVIFGGMKVETPLSALFWDAFTALIGAAIAIGFMRKRVSPRSA